MGNFQTKILHFLGLLKILRWKLLYGSKLKIHPTVTIMKNVEILSLHGQLEIKKGVFFNYGCLIGCRDNICIGENCLFGPNVKIFDHNHKYKDAQKTIKQQGFTKAPIKIGDNCWIASDVTILKGVTIGNHCIIGAGCVIYKDVPSNSIVTCNQQLIEKRI